MVLDPIMLAGYINLFYSDKNVDKSTLKGETFANKKIGGFVTFGPFCENVCS